MCLRGRQFAELCCDAHKLRATRPRHAELVDGAAARAQELGRGTARGVATRQTSAAPAPAQRRAARSAHCTAQTSTPACCRVASFERACVTKVGAKLRDAERQRLAAQHRGDQGLWRFRAPRCARRAVPRAQSRAPTRRCAAAQSGCETRAAAASAARRGATATTLVTTSVRSVPSSASTCAADMPYCTSSAAVCRAISARSGSLSRCPSSTVGTMRGSRRQTPARASRRRARRRAAARAPPTARRRARRCTARARRPAATQRHGDEAARRNAHLREAQQRLAVDAALQDRRDARAPRRAAPAEHVHQVERARLRTRVADRRRVHRVAEPLEVQRVGEPCDAARVNAIRDEAQRRRNLDAEVEPVTAAEAEHTVLTQETRSTARVPARAPPSASGARPARAQQTAPRPRLARRARRVAAPCGWRAPAGAHHSASSQTSAPQVRQPRKQRVEAPARLRLQAAAPGKHQHARLHASRQASHVAHRVAAAAAAAPARFVVGCHAIDGRKLAQLGQILLVGEARLELAQTSRQLRAVGTSGGRAARGSGSRTRRCCRAPPTPKSSPGRARRSAGSESSRHCRGCCRSCPW
jgi:hypothetical protein